MDEKGVRTHRDFESVGFEEGQVSQFVELVKHLVLHNHHGKRKWDGR